jgi:plasmid replication initiation protein
MNVTFFKPNELIAVIDQVHVNRLAKHMCNYFLKYAQEQIKTNIKLNRQTSNLFELSIPETNALAEITAHDIPRIESTLDKLMQPVTIRYKDDPKKIHKLVPIYEIVVDAERGIYRFRLAETMMELLKTSDYFTKLQLTEFNNLISKHSIVLYEWLKRYETSPQIPQLTVEDLRNITHTADKKTYDNFSDLQKRILDVAVNEISEKTPYTVTYEPIKTKIKYRPKVTAIKFTMTKKKSAEQLAGTSGIVTKEIADVSSKYQELCEKYIQFDFCSTPEEFYRATYVADFKQLEWFFDKKKDMRQKDKLKWLLADIKDRNRPNKPRRNNQSAYYQSLFDKEDRETQVQLKQCQSKQGFLVQVLKLQKRHNDNKKIDIEWWM